MNHQSSTVHRDSTHSDKEELLRELAEEAPLLGRLKQELPENQMDSEQLERLRERLLAIPEAGAKGKVVPLWRRPIAVAAVMTGVLLGAWFVLKPVQEACESVECILAAMDSEEIEALQDMVMEDFDLNETAAMLDISAETLDPFEESLEFGDIDIEQFSDQDLELILGNY